MNMQNSIRTKACNSIPYKKESIFCFTYRYDTMPSIINVRNNREKQQVGCNSNHILSMTRFVFEFNIESVSCNKNSVNLLFHITHSWLIRNASSGVCNLLE